MDRPCIDFLEAVGLFSNLLNEFDLDISSVEQSKRMLGASGSRKVGAFRFRVKLIFGKDLADCLDPSASLGTVFKKAHEQMLRTTAVRDKLQDLKAHYFSLLGSGDAQGRGFQLEKIIRELFERFDLDPRASFKIMGEQIDGAFAFEATDYLFEAKWESLPIAAGDPKTASVDALPAGGKGN